MLTASDEFFAPADALLDPDAPAFDPDAYTSRGKRMDGWESRRRRHGDRDRAVLRLGAPGIVTDAIVDTTHFQGNAPEQVALDGCVAEPHLTPDELEDRDWFPLVPPTPVRADHANHIPVEVPTRVTHVRLVIIPDGGVARLRLLGRPLADLRAAADRRGALDLASALYGGTVVAASEEFFAPGDNLLRPDSPIHMGDGWETRRRRDGGHDWVLIALATTGAVDRVVVDTSHFVGNHPESCAVAACLSHDDVPAADARWTQIVDRSRLGPHARHVFDVDDPVPATHLRLDVHPDGGVARLRAFGHVVDDGWRRAGVAWLNALTASAARDMVRYCCAAEAWVGRMVAARPFDAFDALTAAASRIWTDLDSDTWREAFAAHPRIGDRSGPEHTRREQTGTAHADRATLEALAEGNRAYEQRFGHVFLIRAAGRSAEDMLDALRERMDNDATTELRIAAEQQRLIMLQRLDDVMRPGAPA